ncbi:hypothetical protein ACH6EH_06870 [Paenibacillus sp. JSM ZJ436]|uniref:hypothetical protein n=1 Tax=Paenibacillus sp. JSM ZJ436 TaxID=3376190 RepID=UPI0037AD9717
MLNISQSIVQMAGAKTYVLTLDGREYIAYVKTTGYHKCYLEDWETGKRSVSSDGCGSPEQAIEDAWHKIIKE